MESDKFKNLFNWLPSSQNNQSLPNGDREKSDNFFSKITANFEKPTPKNCPLRGYFLILKRMAMKS
jgi:hypothetical protein